MSKTLLLADDSVTIQRVIELTFAHEDVRVISVSDGQRAVQWMDGEWPDIVLADVGVPGVDGYAIAEHVKSSPRLSHVPVLLLAGAFEPVDRARVAQTGCDGVLVKPFEPQQLVSRVKELLARKLTPPPATVPEPAALRDRGAPWRQVEAEPATVTQFPSPIPSRGVETLPWPAATGFDPMSTSQPEPLEPPGRPVWELGLPEPASTPKADESAAAAAPASAPLPALPKVSLVNAFSALLAAEQSAAPSAAAVAGSPAVTEATVEEVVRRVLVRMTDDLVRRLVLETAERLIREEIEKIKASPD